MTSDTEEIKENSDCWPWYAFVFIGLAVTGFFTWLMVSRTLFRRGRKNTAILCFAINLAILLIFSWFLSNCSLAWWWVTSFCYFFNLAWAFCAWIFQRRFIGPAPRKYAVKEWKSWITPLLIGAVVGVCIGTIFSIGPAFYDRIQMRETLDTLDRVTILWDFLRYSFFGLPAGLLLGFWWAGDHRKFRASHVITFLSALFLTITVWGLLYLLFIFLIHKGILIGKEPLSSNAWAIIPPWVSGFRKIILQIDNYNILVLLAVPLLFGAASRIRDFFKKALLIPLTFICLISMSFADNSWWGSIQDQIIYDMSSSDSNKRASAHEWAKIMLRRYPNHMQWPKIAEELSRYYYSEGRYEESRALYCSVIDRYSGSHKWYWGLGRARAALNSPEFGKPSSVCRLEIPMVDYEEYLTHNWMALLSAIRFWEGPEIPESEVKIRLKGLSRSDDKILLNPLDSFADLDDAARNLGYKVIILPADLAKVKALIAAGIPVIHNDYNSFSLIFGIDQSRSAVCAYSFRALSHRLREETRKEAKEILAIEEEGRGQSMKRLARIANETYSEYSFDYWKSLAPRYMGPLLCIVFPEEKSPAVATALAIPLDDLKKQSDGYLAALIGLSCLSQADAVFAVEWAKISAGKIADPMPLYVAHLARLLWESRDKKVKSRIPLQDQFPELTRIFTYFSAPDNLVFLEQARLRFETDLNADIIPWAILNPYISMLDRSDAADLNMIIKVMHKRLSLNPAYSYWQFLADTYEWAGDIPGMVNALKGLISSKPLDFKAKLHLAYGHVLLEQYAEAKEVMDMIDPARIKFDADYPFCQGAIAEWKGDRKKALKKYAQAVEMRRYKPVYHLRYGKLLLKEGLTGSAIKALEWAARIDAEEEIKKEAEIILSNVSRENEMGGEIDL
jgi:tetratricopeptide (TPR) repeat protein